MVLSYSVCALAESSECYGTTSNGRIENAVPLPEKGGNFISYTTDLELSGRTFVHDAVKEIVVQSYKTLDESHPEKVFKYAETGSKNGGLFWPHKTHQNGLSVDFMVPVLNKKGQSVHLKTDAANRFGYDIEFDEAGVWGNLQIDFEALAAHLVALDQQTKNQGYGLWRVIFDPELQPLLLKTKQGDYIRENIKLSSKRSWVRHDEHYHVDFDIPCKPLAK
nr:penicillin-insensitive murein endopeptidase [Marinicella rhabdoformis]